MQRRDSETVRTTVVYCISSSSANIESGTHVTNKQICRFSANIKCIITISSIELRISSLLQMIRLVALIMKIYVRMSQLGIFRNISVDACDQKLAKMTRFPKLYRNINIRRWRQYIFSPSDWILVTYLKSLLFTIVMCTMNATERFWNCENQRGLLSKLKLS